jgi:hypothetical protein
MLHVGVSVHCMFNGTFKADSAVRPPGSNVAAIPDDARATLCPNSNAIGEPLSEICGHKGTRAQTDSTFLYI